MGVRVIGVKIVGSSDLDKRLREARRQIRAFAKDVETSQHGATKATGATEAATAKLGATATRTANQTRTSSRSTTTALNQTSSAAKKSTTEHEKSSRSVLRLSESYNVAGLRASVAIGAAGVAAALLARELIRGLGAGIAMSAEFETQMRNVNSITGMTEQALGGLSQKVLDISKSLPQDASTLASGLYDIASSGFQGAQGLQVLEASAKAATAGLSTTAVAGQAIAGVLNAYGLSASSAKDVSDTLFQTVNLGVISFEQLGQSLGDVVGTAAAAGVSIDGVGQAVATITKAGVKPAEAFTALNQLMAQIIKPTDALAAVFKSLGYESGAAALKAKGLDGVMADILQVTGGNVTTMSSLFTNIRSLKGALALTSDQGKLYKDTIDQWSAAHTGAGATAVALAEQMKATSAQWKLVTNDIQAGTIEVGLKLLPVLVTLMKSMQDLAHQAVPDLQAGVRALNPLFTALWQVGVNVMDVLRTIADVALPAVKASMQVVAGAVVVGLTVIAKALAAATGFLAEHKAVVVLLAAVYAASLLPSLAAVQIAFNKMILTPVVLGLVGLISAAEGGTVALRALAASMLTVQTVATLGIGAALFLAARGFMMMDEAASKAKATFEGMGTSTDVLDPAKMQAGVGELTKTANAAAELGKQYTGTLGVIKGGFSLLFGNEELAKVANDGAAAADALGVLKERAGNAKTNLEGLRSKTNLTDEALIKLAKRQNIDLSAAPKDAGEEMQKLRSYVVDLEKQTGQSTKAMAANIGTDIDAMEAYAKALQDAQDKASSAFTSGTDVLGTYDPKAAAEKVKSANDQLIKSKQDLSDLESSLGGKHKRTVADGQRVDKAAADVTQARTDLAAAQAASGTKGLAAAYRESIAEAVQFSRDITAASAKGLDYRTVARLLEQGPKQAGPVLQTILADHSGKMIKLVNDSEAKLSELNLIVVAQARLTAIAVGSVSDQAVRDLPIALQISQATLLDKGKSTIDELAKKLGTSQAEIRRIAAANGIDIDNGLKPGKAAVTGLSQEVRDLQRQLDGGVSGTVTVNADGATTVLGQVSGLLYQLNGSVSTATVNVVASFGKGLEGYPGKAADNVIKPPWDPTKPKKPLWAGAEGGPIPGTYVGPKADNVIIRANPREYMMPVAAHDFYGTEFMDQIRARRLPKYADGGPLGSRVSSGWGGGGMHVVKVPVHETRSTEFPMNIGVAHFTDEADARKSYEASRLARLGGRRAR